MSSNWKRKLTSRKFWAAIVSSVVSVAVALGAGDGTVAQITAIIMAGATIIAYIIGEGLVDASRKRTSPEEPDGDTEGREDAEEQEDAGAAPQAQCDTQGQDKYISNE